MAEKIHDQAEKAHYRSGLGITRDILRACAEAGIEGSMISEIARKGNLSHYAAIKNCSRLEDAGLLRHSRRGRNMIFVVTENGIMFYREFLRFQEIAKDLKIRY